MPPRVVDVRALRETREVQACQDGGLFPVLACAGDAIVAVVRGGAGHVGLAGRLELLRSLDGGLTWSAPAVVADSDTDDRNPALGLSRDGALVLVYQRMGCYDADGCYRPQLRRADGSQPIDMMVTRSLDRGLTWEPPAPLGVSELADGSPYGKIVALDGEMLLPIYARDRASGATGSYLVRSRDDGRSWGDVSAIVSGMNETGLCALRGGDLLAVLRGADADQAMFAARSTDGGRTWSAPEPIAPPRCHPADLVELGSGDVLLTYGNRRPPYRIEGLIGRNRAQRWSEPLLCFSGPLHGTGAAERRTDLGYPSTAIARSGRRARGVTMYYHQPGDPGEPSERRPPYPVAGYRAIAVSWDEQALLDAVL